MSDLREALQASLGTAYTLERELDGGGMSRVFVAEETALHRRVVIKVLPPDRAGEVSVDRFRREIQLAGQLQHPHIVPVLSAGTVGSLPYFTMPFVDGESLRARLARDGPPPLAEGVRIIRQVADALACAHEQGIVHRDIKPDNILLTRQHAVVTDFGVAKALDAAGARDPTLTALGVALGTPAYMSPEQATADPAADHRADVYSLGVVAYEVLCGSPPFSGRSAHAMIAAHITEMPAALGERCANLPPALSRLVMSMLSKDPARRPQSADEVVKALDALAARRSARTTAWPVRRIAIALAAAVLVGAALTAGRRAFVRRASASEAALAEKSVAVLPFENMSSSKDDEYFSDGMTEEVSSELANVAGLHVAARTSAFAFKGRHQDAIDIARTLRVHNLVEGTVRRVGQQLRVTAQLINGRDGYQLWNATYDRDARDVFRIQQDIAREIASALEIRLAPVAAARSVATPPSVEAHDLYLKGRYYWNMRDGTSMAKAIAFFQDAVRRDSTYALAYAGLADAYALFAAFGDGRPGDVMPRARDAAEHALALDSTVAEAHTSLGIVSIFHDWDWDAAERHLTRAIALAPDYATARLFHGWSLALTGHRDAGLVEMRRARALEPLSPILGTRVATMLYILHRLPEADSAVRNVLRENPGFVPATVVRAQILGETGRFAEAMALFPPLAVMARSSPGDVGVFGFLLARSGDARRARSVIDTLIEQRKRKYLPADDVASIYAGLGQRDSAFIWLNRAVDERSFGAVLLRVEPEMQALSADPRWALFIRRMGLTP